MWSPRLRRFTVHQPVPHIPRAAGTYALLYQLPERQGFTAGKLGHCALGPGWYIYFGSARGSGGLRARIGRHLRPDKALHWHVDYLSQCAPLTEVWYTISEARLECAWAQAVLHLPIAQAPVPGFGSSDCSCLAHLVSISPATDQRPLPALIQQAGSQTPALETLRVTLPGSARP